MDTVEDTVERAFEQIAKGTQVAAERIGIVRSWGRGAMARVIGLSSLHGALEQGRDDLPLEDDEDEQRRNEDDGSSRR